MTKTKITPAIIVERFLPMYEDRWRAYTNRDIADIYIERRRAHDYRRAFIESSFQEALENLLDGQRKLCANNIEYIESYGRGWRETQYAAENAPSPLEEL